MLARTVGSLWLAISRAGLLMMCAVAPCTAWSQTLWTNPGTGSWNTPGNWSLGVPNAASATAFDAIIANGGTAELLAPPDGSVRRLRVGLAGGPGSLLINGGVLNVTENLHLNEGSSGPASVTVQGGSTVFSPSTVVGHSSNSPTSLTVGGSGTVYNASTALTVGRSGTGPASLTLDTGGVVSTGTSTLGQLSGSNGTATVIGPGSVWSSGGTFTVGASGTGTLNILNQGRVSVNNSLVINATSAVNLNGGTLRLNIVSGISRLHFTAGTLQLAGNRFLGSDPLISPLFGTDPAIRENQSLIIEGFTSSVDNRVISVTGGSLTGNSDVDIANGTVSVTKGGVFASHGRSLIAATGIGDATVLVDGLGSSLSAASDNFWGFFGKSAFVTFSNHATGSLGGSLALANSTGTGTRAFVSVLNGATLDINSLALSEFGGTSTLASLTVNGYGSRLSQAGASTITVGHASSGEARISVVSGGAFRTGTGAISINTTGEITLDTDGVFDARGPINMQGGQFNFRGGTLHAVAFNGSLLNQGGKLSPGSTSLPNGAPANGPGSTTIIGNYTQQANATLEIEIGGPLVNSQYDLVNVTGTALLDGDLALSLISGYVPSPTARFTVFNASSLLGFLDNVTDNQRLATTNGQGSFLVHYGPTSSFNPNQIVLTDYLAAAGITGDYNNSGQVEQGDLDMVLQNWGDNTPPVPSGWTNDLPTGQIDQAELDKVLSNWGNTSAPDFRGVDLAVVPEPGAGLVCLAMFAGIMACRSSGTRPGGRAAAAL